jgi:sec-independent protein translocase protein TatA
MGLDNPLHIVFLVVVLLLVFGARRLPEIGRSLGSGMREFKTSVTGELHHDQQSQTTLATGAPQQQQPAPAQQAQATQAQAPSAPAQQAPVEAVAVPAEQPPAS